MSAVVTRAVHDKKGKTSGWRTTKGHMACAFTSAGVWTMLPLSTSAKSALTNTCLAGFHTSLRSPVRVIWFIMDSMERFHKNTLNWIKATHEGVFHSIETR